MNESYEEESRCIADSGGLCRTHPFCEMNEPLFEEFERGVGQLSRQNVQLEAEIAEMRGVWLPRQFQLQRRHQISFWVMVLVVILNGVGMILRP